MLYNPKMVTLAREARGMTQTDLVNQCQGLDQGNLSKMEKGLLSFNDAWIKKISDATDFPISFFKRKDRFADSREYFYRKKVTSSKKEIIRLEATLDLLRMWFNELLANVDINEFSFPQIEVNFIDTPEIIAKKTRAFIDCERGPIENLTRLLEKNGIIIYHLNDAPDKFDGTFLVTDYGNFVIVVNSSIPSDRKRFTIAHELGHIIMHYQFDSNIRDKEIEQEANKFASEFLMPENEIMRDISYFTYKNLSDLKKYWKVSKSSLIYRARALNLISEQKYRTLMIEMSRNGERKVEREILSDEYPVIIDKIVNAYLTVMGYDNSELTEMLSISSADFDKYLSHTTTSRGRMRILA